MRTQVIADCEPVAAADPERWNFTEASPGSYTILNVQILIRHGRSM